MVERRLTVCTWPYQWIYWPAYRAIEDLEREAKVEASFQFANHTNDEQIRARAAQQAAQDHTFVLSLCAPASSGRTSETHIEVLWRLPHWLVAPISVVGAESAPILALPRGSTSGDLARQIYKRRVNDAPSLDVNVFLESCSANTATAAAFTFVPLQSLSNAVSHVEEINSDISQVTAIQLWSEAGAAVDWFKKLRMAVKEVLMSLSSTNGRPSLIQPLIAEGGNLSMGLDARLPAPAYLGDKNERKKRLAELLAFYVVRNAYFPYHFIDAVLGHHVEWIARKQTAEALTRVQDSLSQAISDDFREFVGFDQRLSSLSFEARRDLHTTATRVDGTSLSESLWHHLYRKGGALSALELREFAVRIAGRRLPLHALYREPRRPRCSEGAVCGEVDIGEPCFVCELSGFVRTTARVVLRKLEKPLDRHGWKPATFRTWHETENTGTCLHYTDIEDMVEIFVGEMRGRHDGEEPVDPVCQVAIVNALPTGAGSGIVEQMLVAILWNGPRERHSGSGQGATKKLPDWAAEQSRKGRPGSAWLFYDAFVPVPGECATCVQVRDGLWQTLRTDCDVTPFSFAYVALLGCRQHKVGDAT